MKNINKLNPIDFRSAYRAEDDEFLDSSVGFKKGFQGIKLNDSAF